MGPLKLVFLLALVALLVHGSNCQTPSFPFLGKNCTTSLQCESESALCLNGTCSLCGGGLDASLCAASFGVMQRCMPFDSTLPFETCFDSNSSSSCVCKHKPLLYQNNVEPLDVIGGVIVSTTSPLSTHTNFSYILFPFHQTHI